MANVKTGEVQFNYLYWSEPNKDGKWGAMICIPKEDKTTINAVLKAIDEVAGEHDHKIEVNKHTNQRELVSKKDGKRCKHFPLKDGDVEGKPEAQGCYYVNANNYKRPPSVVDKDRNDLMSNDEFMSTDFGRAFLSLYWYDNKNGKGVGVGLDACQVLRHGSREFGGASAKSVFDDDFETESPAEAGDDWMD